MVAVQREQEREAYDEIEEIGRGQIMYDWSGHNKKFGFYHKGNRLLPKCFEQASVLIRI